MYGLLNLGDVVKAAIETAGSRVTGAEVTVDDVTFDLGAGTAGLSGLSLGNPQGPFETERALYLGAVSATVDTENSTDKVIVIKEVSVNAPQVTYELATGGSNIDVLRHNVSMATGGDGGAASSAPDDAAEEDIKVIIDDLYMRDGKVAVSGGGLGKTLSTDLPTIHLEDIGRSSGGASPTEVAAKVLDAVIGSSTKAVSGLDIKGLSGEAQKAIEEGAGSAGSTLEGGLKGLMGN